MIALKILCLTIALFLNINWKYKLVIVFYEQIIGLALQYTKSNYYFQDSSDITIRIFGFLIFVLNEIVYTKIQTIFSQMYSSSNIIKYFANYLIAIDTYFDKFVLDCFGLFKQKMAKYCIRLCGYALRNKYIQKYIFSFKLQRFALNMPKQQLQQTQTQTQTQTHQLQNNLQKHVHNLGKIRSQTGTVEIMKKINEQNMLDEGDYLSD